LHDSAEQGPQRRLRRVALVLAALAVATPLALAIARLDPLVPGVERVPIRPARPPTGR
jgi:hypothetical protein